MKAAREPSATGVTEDAFLGGRIVLAQPRKGHRSGLEAVLIAAAAPLESGHLVIDIGAGAGAAGLCALSRVPGSKAILVEADASMAELAGGNIMRNGFADRCRVVASDVTRAGAANRAGLAGIADHALVNPPFHDPARARLSPHKRAAHGGSAAAFDAWLRFAAAVVRPRGTLTLVHRADALDAVLRAVEGRFGGLCVLPLHPRPGEPASRIVVQGIKGGRGPLTLLSGVVLHGASGNGFAAGIEDVLRHAAPLPLVARGARPHLCRPGDLPE